jgi:hypothetical protein
MHLVSWISDHESVVLNVLKIAGTMLTSVAGIVATLTETKTPDRTHLSQGGRFLLFLGILGFGIAIVCQMIEWQRGIEETELAQKRNELTLGEIRRAVTRFSSVEIALDVKSFGLGASGQSQGDLSSLWNMDMSSLRRHFGDFDLCTVSSEDNGVYGIGQTVCWSRMKRLPSSVPPNKNSMPHWNNPTSEWPPGLRNGPQFLILGTQNNDIHFLRPKLQLKIYRHRVEPNQVDSIAPDLLLRFRPREVLAIANMEAGLRDIKSIALSEDDIPAPSSAWSMSGSIISVQDLNGAQAFLELDRGPLPTPSDEIVWWRSSRGISISLKIDHRTIKLNDCNQVGVEWMFLAECDVPRNLMSQ